MHPQHPLARSRRRWIVMTAVISISLLLVLSLKIVTMQVGQILGDRAWRSGDSVAAERYFELSGQANFFQRWIAPFNRGVAAHGQREWDDAVMWFVEALELAPDSARCRIVLNWVWTLEAAADEYAAAGNKQEAEVRWRGAQRVLNQATNCDDGSSGNQPTEPEPEPEPDEPSPTPEPEDSEQASSESDEGEAEADSEQGQLNETQERLEGKITGQRELQDDGDRPDSEDKSERLTERNREGAKIRQNTQDQRQTEEQDSGPRRTW